MLQQHHVCPGKSVRGKCTDMRQGWLGSDHVAFSERIFVLRKSLWAARRAPDQGACSELTVGVGWDSRVLQTRANKPDGTPEVDGSTVSPVHHLRVHLPPARSPLFKLASFTLQRRCAENHIGPTNHRLPVPPKPHGHCSSLRRSSSSTHSASSLLRQCRPLSLGRRPCHSVPANI